MTCCTDNIGANGSEVLLEDTNVSTMIDHADVFHKRLGNDLLTISVTDHVVKSMWFLAERWIVRSYHRLATTLAHTFGFILWTRLMLLGTALFTVNLFAIILFWHSSFVV